MLPSRGMFVERTISSRVSTLIAKSSRPGALGADAEAGAVLRDHAVVLGVAAAAAVGVKAVADAHGRAQGQRQREGALDAVVAVDRDEVGAGGKIGNRDLLVGEFLQPCIAFPPRLTKGFAIPAIQKRREMAGSHPGSNPMAKDNAKLLIECLNRSQIYQDYERAFSEAKGPSPYRPRRLAPPLLPRATPGRSGSRPSRR